MPRLDISSIVVSIAIGVIVAVGLYQVQLQGLIPTKGINNTVTTEETRTIVQEENAVISVVEKASPSVVAIGAKQRIPERFSPFSTPRSRDQTIGTGFIVSDKGVVVTNRHVVDNTQLNYSVVTKDGKKLTITKIYRDPNLDLALLKVEGSSLGALELGDSSKLKVGQTVIAIGNALGEFSNTVTTGVVSGLGRAVTAGDPFTGFEKLEDLIQTDAAINPGNSGGPLLNSAGQVVGVNVATTEGAQNIGFAIPINSVKALAEEFISTGTITRAFLGIRYSLITRDKAVLYDLPVGAYIEEVVSGSPADKSDLREGDVITKINGAQINEDTQVADIISKSGIGSTVEMEVWREEQTLKLNATLETAPSE